MDFRQKKVPFLQMKEQEKAKLKDQENKKNAILRVQKNLRGLLATHQAINASPQPLIECLRLRVSLAVLNPSIVEIHDCMNIICSPGFPEPIAAPVYLKRLILAAFLWDPSTAIILLEKVEPRLAVEIGHRLYKSPFHKLVLSQVLRSKDKIRFLILTVEALASSTILQKLPQAELLDGLLLALRTTEQLPPILTTLSRLWLCNHNSSTALGPSNLLEGIGSILRALESGRINCTQQVVHSQALIIKLFSESELTKYDELTRLVSEQRKHISSLIEDQEDLEAFQNRIREDSRVRSHKENFLKELEHLLQHPVIMKQCLSEQGVFQGLKQLVFGIVSSLQGRFKAHQVIFLRGLICSDEYLRGTLLSDEVLRYEGLSLRLAAMEDREFKRWNIFSPEQWQRFIHTAVQIVRNCIKFSESQLLAKGGKREMIPFRGQSNQERTVSVLVRVLCDLYKKFLHSSPEYLNIFHVYDSSFLLNFVFPKEFSLLTAESFLTSSLLKKVPFVFSFPGRHGVFTRLIKADKLNYDRSLFMLEEIPEELIVRVRRGQEFYDAFHQCINRDMRNKYQIVFFNEQGLEEQGIDGGGLIKEFINKVLKMAFNPIYNLFLQTRNNEIIPNPGCNFKEEYEFVGMMVGKAVYEGFTIECKFADPFLNLLQGRKNILSQLSHIDPEVYESLIRLLHAPPDEIDQSCLTFTIADRLPDGTVTTVHLSGSNDNDRLVNHTNVREFVMKYSDFKCNTQLQEKTRPFRKGLMRVLKPQWVQMFDNTQLNSLISGGVADFNVEDLMLNTLYQGYEGNSPTIKDFWTVLASFASQEKTEFLTFLSSCPRPPVFGFSQWKPKFRIFRIGNPQLLPVVNTCMNQLKLPDYKDIAKLRHKLLMAIKANVGFEIV